MQKVLLICCFWNSKTGCAIRLLFFIHLFVGFEKIVHILIENGVNVKAVNEKNNSALIFAASKGNYNK